MPTTLQLRRGNTTQNNSFTGAAGEISFDTTTNTLRIHDGSTAGGYQIVSATASQTLTNKTLTSPTINGGTFSGTFTGTISPGAITTNSITSNGSNADISIQPSGTGDIVLSALRVNGTTLDSSDSSTININENTIVDGTLTVSGALASSTSLALASGATVTAILDEDAMGTDSATALATQQSIKAYADTKAALTGSTDNTIATVTGAHALQGEANLTFDGSTLGISGAATISTTLAVTGAATFTGGVTTGALTTNAITSNGSNADLSLQPSGTGDVLISALRVNGTTLDSSDSSTININEALIVDGTATVSGALASSTSLALASGATVTGIADEDDLTSNSDTLLATQQSIKAYVDAQVTASDLDFQGDSGGALSIDLDSETMTFTGGTGIDTSGSGNAVTFAIDSTVATLTGSQTLTNKTITSPTISTPTVTGTLTATSVTTNDIVSNGSNADITLDPTGTGDINLTAGADVNLPADIGLTFGNDGEKIEGDGTDLTISTSNNVTIDAAADIVLDAGGADVTLKDDGTTFGSLTNSGGELVIKSGSTPTVAATFAGAAVTFASSVTVGSLVQSGSNGITVSDNSITTGSSNADIKITPHGTGKVKFNDAYTFPTSDGTNGTALVTDGSGALSFSTVGDASASDDGAGVAIADKRITSTARTIDSWHSTFQDSVLYYVVSNDHNEDCVNIQKVSVCHDDTTAYISSAGAQSKASTTMTAFTAALDNDMVRLKAASSNAVGGTLSFYKFGLGDNTSTGTSGNVIISQNTDVDSASESLVSFAHGTYRGAKLFISINNNAKTEVGNVEALVVHDGSDAFISQFGGIQTGDNPLLTLTAAIDGSNVVVSAAGGEANLRVTVHAIMLKDTMTSDDGTYANTEAIAPVTISSTATEVDTLVEASNNGAVYYLVSKNASEGAYAVNEVFMAMGSGEITVASGPFVSTKGTNQLAFTSDYKDDVENTGQLLCASTSGGSTTVSAYRINCLAK